MEKKLQVASGDDWWYLSAIRATTFVTANNREEALSDDYLGVVRNIFPNMAFRSI